MARILLVRHGITEFNSGRRFAGFTDIELSEAGYRQIEKLRDRLASERINAIYTSDLKRAAASAGVIAAGRGIEVVPCPELREINYGAVEGLTFDGISQLYPEVAQRVRNFSIELAFPGGESFHDFVARTSGFLSRIERHAAEDTVLVVSHSGPVRVLVYTLLGFDMAHWWQVRIDNASLSIVDTYPRGAILSLLNDTSHLR